MNFLGIESPGTTIQACGKVVHRLGYTKQEQSFCSLGGEPGQTCNFPLLSFQWGVVTCSLFKLTGPRARKGLDLGPCHGGTTVDLRHHVMCVMGSSMQVVL